MEGESFGLPFYFRAKPVVQIKRSDEVPLRSVVNAVRVGLTTWAQDVQEIIFDRLPL